MRRRNRLRTKELVADSTTALDLGDYKPAVTLKTRGKALLDYYRDDTPFWWTEADLPMVSLMCAGVDAAADAFRNGSPAGQAAILKEVRSMMDALGLSPQARARLKLTEAQSVTAAKKVEAMQRRNVEAMDLDDLADG